MSKVIGVLAVLGGAFWVLTKYNKQKDYNHDEPTVELQRPPNLEPTGKIQDLTNVTMQVNGQETKGGAQPMDFSIPFNSLYPSSTSSPY
jgi:hypothetical protein